MAVSFIMSSRFFNSRSALVLAALVPNVSTVVSQPSPREAMILTRDYSIC